MDVKVKIQKSARTCRRPCYEDFEYTYATEPLMAEVVVYYKYKPMTNPTPILTRIHSM